MHRKSNAIVFGAVALLHSVAALGAAAPSTAAKCWLENTSADTCITSGPQTTCHVLVIDIGENKPAVIPYTLQIPNSKARIVWHALGNINLQALAANQQELTEFGLTITQSGPSRIVAEFQSPPAPITRRSVAYSVKSTLTECDPLINNNS